MQFCWRWRGKVVSAIRIANIIRPLPAAAVVFHPPVSRGTAKVAILLAAVPSGFFGLLFAVNRRLVSVTAGSLVTASISLSTVTLAVAIAVPFPH